MTVAPHQIITGALNSGESAFAVGSVEGINFTACAVGCDIVILASDFQRVQIIPGSTTGYVQALCVDCCYETGKIAAAFYDLIRIYEPMALSSHTSHHKLDYQWFETCCFNVGSAVTNLSWNLEGLRLLVSTEKELQMFQHRALTEYYFCSGDDELGSDPDKGHIKFDLGEQQQPPQNNHNNNDHPSSMLPNSVWECVWKNQLSSPLRYIKFSPDGTLFATAGSNDHLVKIWYQDSGGGLDSSDVTFSFIYLAHPKPVVGFEWRKTGRYMPRGCVANVLITWCRDHICRIWCETSVPTEIASDMLLDLKSERFPPRVGGGGALGAGADDKDRHKHHRLKNARVKITHRLKHLKKIKKTTGSPSKHKTTDKSGTPTSTRVTVPSLSLVPSVSVLPESFDLPPVLHFHLAASICAETDCFLVPSLDSGALSETTFAVHWLNNKELIFSLGAEKLLAEALAIEHPGAGGLWYNAPSPVVEHRMTSQSGTDKNSDDGSSTHSAGNEALAYSSSRLTASSTAESISALGNKDILDLKLEQLLREWQHSADILFTIHPLDGSLLVWTMDYLDDCGRQPQVSFSSRLPAAFPMSDAASLNHNLAIFNPHDPIYVDLLRRATEYHGSGLGFLKTLSSVSTDLPGQLCNTIFLLTTHRNGTLNLWHLNIDEKSKFCTILSIAHKSRMCGHRFRVSGISCHPVLPLFLTISHHNIRRRKLHRKPGDAGVTKEAAPQLSQDVQIFNSELILWKVNPVGPLCKSGGVRELARINSPDISAFSSVAWIPAILPSSTLGSISNSPSSCFVASDGRCLRVYQAVIDARALLAEVNYAKAQKARIGVMSNSSSGEGGLLSPADKTISDSCNIVSTQSTARPGCIIELDAISDAFHDWKHIQLLHVFNEQMILSDQRTSLSSSATPANAPLTPSAVLRQNFFTAEEASSVIDRTKSTAFHDRFYLVVLEKNKSEQGGAIIHMWLLGMASQAPQPLKGGSPRKSVSSLSPADDHEPPEFYPTAENSTPLSTAKLFIYSKKVCSQLLPLPPGVKVVGACPAAGHLSSSSLYPACRAPFLLTTACSDDRVRFWYVRVETDEGVEGETRYKWAEWRTVSESQDSQLEMDGRVFAVSSAFSGRFACSYDPSNSYDTGRSDVLNVEVAVYECESTGGIEWQQEDIIHLRNIVIPRGLHHAEEYAFPAATPAEEFLSDYHNEKRYGGNLLPRVPSIPKLASSELRRVVSEHNLTKQSSEYTPHQVVRLDWVSTEDGSHVLTVGIGAKILLFAPVSADVAQQNVAIMKEMDSNPLHAKRQQLMRKASTIAAPIVKKLIRWVALRSIDLDSADGLPPLPLMLSWVREGILVVGMESEMRVYHQWNISSVTHTESGQQHALGHLDRISEGSHLGTKHDGVDNAEHPTAVVKFDFDQKRVSGMLAAPTLAVTSAATPLSATFRQLRISPSHSMLDLAKKGKEAGVSGSATSSSNLTRRGRDRKRPGDDVSKKDDVSSAGSEVISVIRDEGLFEAARLATPLIPQYHPKQLMELLNAGKTRRVKAILLHVLRCIRENNVVYSDALARQASVHSDDHDMSSGRGHSLTRMKTELSPDDSSKTFVEIDSIPPLPLHALMAADSASSGAAGSEKDSGVSMGGTKGATYEDLFSGAQPNEELDIDWGDDDEDEGEEGAEGSNIDRSNSLRRRRQSISSTDMVSTTAFGAKHARMLSKLLTHIQLPGLSSVDQMHLLAVADTLSSFSADAIDRLAQANASLKTPVGGVSVAEGAGYAVTGAGIDSVDECGLRFLMAMKQHEYLLRCLPLKQRAHLKAAGLPTSHIIWALHSETENELLNSLSCMQKGSPRWHELRAVGVGWWLKSTATLRQLMEKVAKAAFQAQSDPMDAALYYLAMKKKNLLTHLYKTAKDTKMTDFFSQDFAQEKWKKAALKNAFILMGKQRFEHAVAFFLLGDSLNDALQVCVANLNDLQLALAIVRLFEADPDRQQSLTRRLLRKHVIGNSDDTVPKSSSTTSFDGSTGESTDDRDRDRAEHFEPVSDPFLRSMAYWLMKDYHRSAMVLLEESDTYVIYEGDNSGVSSSRYTISDVFNFYAYLRTHPLVVRQRLNAAGVNIGSTERFLQVAKAMESQITPVERKLYFKTASTHFKSGCALLALEVLCKLPKNICVVPPTFDEDGRTTGKGNDVRKLSFSATMKIPEIVVKKEEQVAGQRSDAVDWGASSLENGFSTSKRFVDEPLELKWDDDDEEGEKSGDDEGGLVMKSDAKKASVAEDQSRRRSVEEGGSLDATGGQFKLDIMAQQLKFIACLKILMEELATLASGYEIDGGQLRIQLYHWLEREVEVLKRWCDYNVGVNVDTSIAGEAFDDPNAPVMDDDPQQPVLLHVALRSDRASLTAKCMQAYRRRRWLAMNQQLLRTLIAYCSLHSSQGVGLASARMELLLLLQELHQEPAAQKTLLASPIPLQSSFPLLAASVASIKTDIAGPLRYLHCQISDLLKSFAELRTPELREESLTKVYMFYNLSQSLSACIYDSLWEIESLPTPKAAASAGVGSGVLLRKRRHTSSVCDPELTVTSAPNKWPGVENLMAWLSRERDEDVPNLLLLLAESWVAVYLSMFAYALTAYDSRWLYRLVAHPINANMFATVFGGGGEKRVAVLPDSAGAERSPRPARPPPPRASESSREQSPNPLSIDYLASAADPSKIRAKFHAKVFGQASTGTSSPAGVNGPASLGSVSSQPHLVATLKQWVPPKKSIVAYFVSRPQMSEAEQSAGVDYDSDASLEESDTELDEDADSGSIGGGTTAEKVVEPKYHDDPNSYAWAILRQALIRQAILRLQQFLAVCGLEYGELGAVSPLIHRCVKTLEEWRRYAESILDMYPGGCPPHFLPDMSLDVAASSSGPSVRKYRVVLEPDNTPFSSGDRTALPVKRLWSYLVRQEHLTDIFIRYIFRSKKPDADGVNDAVAMTVAGGGPPSSTVSEPLKIAQREQDPITSFAVSRAHVGWIVLSTGREIQEMDLSHMFAPNVDWMHDTTELDLAMFEMKKDPLRDNDDYVLITPEKRESAIANRGTSFLCKRPVSGVRRMEAHPHLPYYISGANDGSVRLWEWGAGQPLFTPRGSGQFQKVTKTRFNAQGNKFGITDGDGNICLWQISHGMSMKKPFLTFGCHTKSAADFVFIGNSSSLLATAGYSSGDVNIALWDSLLPAHKALVQSWSCHPEGATCLAYAPMLQALLSAGRHGEVCIWDVRQRQLRQTLKVFDHTPVKCMALDPAQEFFAVGSGDGDIKVWSLAAVPHLLYNFPGEHAAKGGFSLRQVGSGQVQGVQHMWIDSHQRLYSCGADCSLKMRILPSQTQEPHAM